MSNDLGVSVKPLIGVTKPLKGGLTQNLAIVACLRILGAKTRNITVLDKAENINFDGILISGGTDLHPQLYKSNELKKDYHYDQERDKLELEWIKRSYERRIPLFCICRGAQLLNISRGGSLHTDINKTHKGTKYPSSLIAKIFFRKKIYIEEGTILSRIVGKKTMMVNSMHSQAIGEVGDNLKVTSCESNKVIQSVEDIDENHKILGVQFHPEFLIHMTEVQNIFKWFIQVCISRKLEG